MAKTGGFVTVHGKQFGLDHYGRLMGAGAGRGLEGVRVGTEADGDDYILAHGPQRKASVLDDFLGKTISSQWQLRHGSDGGVVDFAHSSALGGMARGVTGAGAGADYATNGVQLDDGMLNWEADKGSLVYEAAVKVSAITTMAIYLGFTDQVSALEMPFTLGAGDALTSNCSDGCGFLFDTGADTDSFWLVGVANDVDATKQNISDVPSTTAFHRYRVEVDSSGNASFYIDGDQVGTRPVSGQNYNLANATRATIPLTPIIAAFTRAAGSVNVDADWLWVQQDR